MEIQDNEAFNARAVEEPPQPSVPATIAPLWHTILLIVGIIGLSIAGSMGLTSQRHSSSKLFTYATTAGMEMLMFAWLAFGLWLRKVPLRSLFGSMARGARGVGLDLGVAAVFWIGSMIVLGAIGITWTTVEYAATHKNTPIHPGQKIEPSPAQKETIEMLSRLAPANGKEIASWAALCMLAGLIEEAVFRGYLQQQFIAWSRGRIAVGVAASALMFGAAHGYQGVRNMVLLGVFGVLFSLLALFRRSLRAGIFAHSWHDLFVGLLLMLLRTRHLI